MSYLAPFLPFFLIACFIWPWLWLIVLALVLLYILIVNDILH